MNVYPEIYNLTFGNNSKSFTKRYAMVNAIILRELLSRFSTDSPWRIEIADYRDGDLLPHYAFEFGMNMKDFSSKTLPSTSKVTKYCDNWSSAEMQKIEQSLGVLCVDVMGDYGDHSKDAVASLATQVYFKALERVFTDHYAYLFNATAEPKKSKKKKD